METPIRSATSPDGRLVLELYAGDDFLIGFKGNAWHTHGDLLVPDYGQTPAAAAMAFFDSIVADAQPIWMQVATGEAWLASQDIEHDATDEPAGLVIRLWSGKVVKGTIGA